MGSPDPRRTGDLAAALGHVFDRPDRLVEALTHPSMAGLGAASRTIGRAYERLEFLGDRVLGLVIAEWLLETHPDEREGDIARRQSALVARDAVVRIAERIGLGDHIVAVTGVGDVAARAQPAMLADALEAVIAVVFLDGGLDAARRVVRRLWADEIGQSAPPQDAKTRLQEWAQGRRRRAPVYETVDRQGPDHAPVFTVRVTVGGVDPAVATGRSKQEAEKAAAQALLDRLPEGRR
jgi:ribonuclease-3